MSNALTRTSLGQWNCDSWSCSTDRALARFKPCRSKCVSHAKWRTDVVYGQSNIVLRCLHCTWWYGANRGICQMQSGVMEGRDRAGDRERGREWGGGLSSLSPAKLSLEHQLWGDKDQNMCSHPSMRTALFWEENTSHDKPKAHGRQFPNHTATQFHEDI